MPTQSTRIRDGSIVPQVPVPPLSTAAAFNTRCSSRAVGGVAARRLPRVRAAGPFSASSRVAMANQHDVVLATGQAVGCVVDQKALAAVVHASVVLREDHVIEPYELWFAVHRDGGRL